MEEKFLTNKFLDDAKLSSKAGRYSFFKPIQANKLFPNLSTT